MIQEIGEGRYNPEYRNIEITDNDKVMSIIGSSVLIRVENKQAMIPSYADIRNDYSINEAEVRKSAYYLFSIDEKPFFSIDLSKDIMEEIKVYDSPEECINDIEKMTSGVMYFYMAIHKLRELKPVEMIFAAVTAVHIMTWKRSRTYCGVCGEKAVESKTERAMICPKCQSAEYPKICPAVIVAIKNQDGKLLLVRNKLGFYHKLALVSGFVEVGESFEDTVKREVLEEVGLKVKNLKFFGSQPWGFSLCEMIGYTAEVDGDDTITLQESELSEGNWYTREEVPSNASGLSIGNEMIHKFKTGEF